MSTAAQPQEPLGSAPPFASPKDCRALFRVLARRFGGEIMVQLSSPSYYTNPTDQWYAIVKVVGAELVDGHKLVLDLAVPTEGTGQ